MSTGLPSGCSTEPLLGTHIPWLVAPYHFQNQQWPIQSFCHCITLTSVLFFPSCICFRGSLWLHFVHSNNPKFLPILRLVDHPHFNFICGFNSSLPHSKAYSENTGIRTRASLWRGQPQHSAVHNVQDTFQNLRFRSKFRDHPIQLTSSSITGICGTV